MRSLEHFHWSRNETVSLSLCGSDRSLTASFGGKRIFHDSSPPIDK
jgi:hypothetical protein